MRIWAKAWREINAPRAIASAFGLYVGLFAMEHGYFETLQGRQPSSWHA